jgi:hypothetical protein
MLIKNIQIIIEECAKINEQVESIIIHDLDSITVHIDLNLLKKSDNKITDPELFGIPLFERAALKKNVIIISTKRRHMTLRFDSKGGLIEVYEVIRNSRGSNLPPEINFLYN